MMMRRISIALAIATTLAATTLLLLPVASSTLRAQEFASIQTFQDRDHIVITISKNGTATQGPIIVIPPKPTTNATTPTSNNQTEPTKGQNATILVPAQNVTKPGEGNVTVITPGGNVTVLPGDSNVTKIDNGTLVVAPPDRNITETPGNVTVIDPAPAPPVSAENKTCTCQKASSNATAPVAPPANETKAPAATNETTSATNSTTATTPTPSGNQTVTNSTTITNSTAPPLVSNKTANETK